jgi:hypothetical protein
VTKLVHALCLFLELHCMAGFRDHQFSSIGRAPLKVMVDDKDDTELFPQRRYLHVSYKHMGVNRERWLIVSDAEFDRVEVGKSYSLVKTQAIQRPDKYAIQWVEGQ